MRSTKIYWIGKDVVREFIASMGRFLAQNNFLVELSMRRPPNIEKSKNLRFGGLPVLKSTQEFFSAQNKKSIFFEKKFRFFFEKI